MHGAPTSLAVNKRLLNRVLEGRIIMKDGSRERGSTWAQTIQETN